MLLRSVRTANADPEERLDEYYGYVAGFIAGVRSL